MSFVPRLRRQQIPARTEMISLVSGWKLYSSRRYHAGWKRRYISLALEYASGTVLSSLRRVRSQRSPAATRSLRSPLARRRNFGSAGRGPILLLFPPLLEIRNNPSDMIFMIRTKENRFSTLNYYLSNTVGSYFRFSQPSCRNETFNFFGKFQTQTIITPPPSAPRL